MIGSPAGQVIALSPGKKKEEKKMRPLPPTHTPPPIIQAQHGAGWMRVHWPLKSCFPTLSAESETTAVRRRARHRRLKGHDWAQLKYDCVRCSSHDLHF